ncbi:hypothetical protein NV379_17045 [Paenibacillus sp. N1-5-1-14]|uniref:hypothetical protein n=1 Tax=Paenibacillus radicibacter TaxID=2972488 RepID=UPI0021599ABB|nr:hypothetical protein [Paenibacillus radicibacter]MCR8644362.1 hypothetical protein [Paenibacillus radicibacter]
MSVTAMGAGFGFLAILSFLINSALVVLGIFVLVLLIKLLKRGIEALDIYLYEKSRERSSQNNDYRNQL